MSGEITKYMQSIWRQTGVSKFFMWGQLTVIFTAIFSSPSAASQDGHNSNNGNSLSGSAYADLHSNENTQSPEYALFYGHSDNTASGDKNSSDPLAMAVCDYDTSRYTTVSRYRNRLLDLIDAELAVIEASEKQGQSFEVESREKTKRSYDDVISLIDTTLSPSTDKNLLTAPVYCSKIDLEYPPTWMAPYALEPVIAVGLARESPATTDKITLPAATIATVPTFQKNYAKLPECLFSKLVLKIGKRMNCREPLKWNSDIQEIFGYAINRFGAMLELLRSKAINGIGWNVHKITINSATIEAALGRIKTFRDRKGAFSIGKKNCHILFDIVCGNELYSLLAPDCINTVALHIYAHAVALYGDIDGAYINHDGLLFVNGKYFPSSAEISGSRGSPAKKNKRKEANNESSEPTRDLDYYFSDENVQLNLSVAPEDAEMVGSNNQGVHAEDVEVDRPQHLSNQSAYSSLSAIPVANVEKQVNCAHLPTRLLIQLVNIVGEATKKFESIAPKTKTSDALGQVVDRFEVLLKSLLLQFDEGREVNMHNVKINRTSIQTALGNISEHRILAGGLEFYYNGARSLVRMVCVNKVHPPLAADCIKLAALHFFVNALTVHGNIEGISYGPDGVLRMGDRYFPTGAQISAERLESKKRKRALSDSNDGSVENPRKRRN